MDINTKVQDEKIIIITEDQILKALGLSNKKYELNYSETIYTGINKVVIHMRAKDSMNRSVKMNLVESKTLDEFIGD